MFGKEKTRQLCSVFRNIELLGLINYFEIFLRQFSVVRLTRTDSQDSNGPGKRVLSYILGSHISKQVRFFSKKIFFFIFYCRTVRQYCRSTVLRTISTVDFRIQLIQISLYIFDRYKKKTIGYRY